MSGAASDKPKVADLARLYKLGHGSNGVFDRRVGIDPVLIVEVDHVHLQPAQRSFAGQAHIVRLSINSDESAIGRPDIAKLRRKDDLVSTILDGFANEFLVLTQSVNVGGVQESDAKLDGAVNCGDRPRAPRRLRIASVAASRKCTLWAVLAVTIRFGPPGRLLRSSISVVSRLSAYAIAARYGVAAANTRAVSKYS